MSEGRGRKGGREGKREEEREGERNGEENGEREEKGKEGGKEEERKRRSTREVYVKTEEINTLPYIHAYYMHIYTIYTVYRVVYRHAQYLRRTCSISRTREVKYSGLLNMYACCSMDIFRSSSAIEIQMII